MAEQDEQDDPSDTSEKTREAQYLSPRTPIYADELSVITGITDSPRLLFVRSDRLTSKVRESFVVADLVLPASGFVSATIFMFDHMADLVKRGLLSGPALTMVQDRLPKLMDAVKSELNKES